MYLLVIELIYEGIETIKMIKCAIFDLLYSTVINGNYIFVKKCAANHNE